MKDKIVALQLFNKTTYLCLWASWCCMLDPANWTVFYGTAKDQEIECDKKQQAFELPACEGHKKYTCGILAAQMELKKK